jgi:hypothetical protein
MLLFIGILIGMNIGTAIFFAIYLCFDGNFQKMIEYLRGE